MNEEGRIANVSAALLLGGASERMGRDKAHLPLPERPAAAVIAELLAGLFEDVMLVGGDPPPDAPGRRVADGAGARCALRGLVAALDAARHDRVLVVATDLFGVHAEILLGLLSLPPAAVALPRRNARLEPLCAVYTVTACLEPARRRLEGGDLALHGLIEELGSVSLLEDDDLHALDPDGRALANVNTPEDWAEFRARGAP